MKRNVKTFGQWSRLNEEIGNPGRNDYDPNLKVLWIQSLNGEITWMSVTDWANVDVMANRGGMLNAFEDGICDLVTVHDISKGGDIHVEGKSSSSELPIVPEDGCEIIAVYHARDYIDANDDLLDDYM